MISSNCQMGQGSASVKISDADFEMIRDFIYSHCGIYMNASKKYYLENRLSRRMCATGIKSHEEYGKLLRDGVRGKEELRHLLNELTTTETRFFRIMPQLSAMENRFLPEIVEAKQKIGFRKIRVWSAGTSSGEEPYTLAMILLEKMATILKGWTVEVIGTDINETILAKAREGIFNGYAVRNMPEYYRKKYFLEENPERYVLSQEVKKLVTFSHLNLYDDSRMVFMKSFDFIFCANVLIYFDESSKAKVVQHFYNNLLPYGYLFVGQSESLHGVNDRFKTVHFPGGFAYRK